MNEIKPSSCTHNNILHFLPPTSCHPPTFLKHAIHAHPPTNHPPTWKGVLPSSLAFCLCHTYYLLSTNNVGTTPRTATGMGNGDWVSRWLFCGWVSTIMMMMIMMIIISILLSFCATRTSSLFHSFQLTIQSHRVSLYCLHVISFSFVPFIRVVGGLVSGHTRQTFNEWESTTLCTPIHPPADRQY